MAEEKTFVGNVKKLGNWAFKLGIPKDKINELVNLAPGSWVNIVIVKEGKKGPYAYLDEFVPDGERGNRGGSRTAPHPTPTPQQSDARPDDDLPF